MDNFYGRVANFRGCENVAIIFKVMQYKSGVGLCVHGRIGFSTDNCQTWRSYNLCFFLRSLPLLSHLWLRV